MAEVVSFPARTLVRPPLALGAGEYEVGPRSFRENEGMASKKHFEGRKRQNAKGRKGRGGPHLGRSANPTPREMRVIDRYFANGFRKIEAMAHCGYKGAETNTYEFFNRPVVAAEIQRREDRLRHKFEVNEERVVQELAAIGFARLSNVIVVDPDTGEAEIDMASMGPAERAAISEFTVEKDPIKGDRIKVKLHDKQGALEKLGKYLGLFKEKVEVDAGADLAALLLAGRKRAETKE